MPCLYRLSGDWNTATATAAPRTGRAAEIFAALRKRLAVPKAADGCKRAVLHVRVKDPEASWLVDLSGRTPKIEQGATAQASAVFGIDDADLVALVQGEAQVRDLYQRGKLRVDGDVKLAHELRLLHELI